MEKAKAPTLEQTVERMKSEILADMRAGRVPETCHSFSELHDYVDANCYGGFCNDDFLSELWGFYGASSDDGCPAEVYEFTNNAQLAVDEWLRARFVTVVAADGAAIQ